MGRLQQANAMDIPVQMMQKNMFIRIHSKSIENALKNGDVEKVINGAVYCYHG